MISEYLRKKAKSLKMEKFKIYNIMKKRGQISKFLTITLIFIFIIIVLSIILLVTRLNGG